MMCVYHNDMARFTIVLLQLYAVNTLQYSKDLYLLNRHTFADWCQE